MLVVQMIATTDILWWTPTTLPRWTRMILPECGQIGCIVIDSRLTRLVTLMRKRRTVPPTALTLQKMGRLVCRTLPPK
jgi:hypothetical protein